MSVHQWFVIALNIAAFLGMVTMFAFGSYDKAVKRETEYLSDDSTLDYRQYRKI